MSAGAPDTTATRFTEQLDINSYGKKVPRLFETFPGEVKNDPHVVRKAIECCTAPHVDRLFAVFPDEVKQDPHMRTKAIEHCPDMQIPNLFETFPDRVKQDPQICIKAIECCAKLHVLDLFKTLPDEGKKDPTVCKEAIKHCDAKDLNAVADLWGLIPKELQTDKSLIAAREEKIGGGILGKSDACLKTAGRFSLVAICCVGFIESIMYGIGKILGPEILETHWRKGKSWVFAPLPDCPLPPPPLIWISGLMDAMKAGAFTLMFGYMRRELHRIQHDLASRMKRMTFVMGSLFQLVIVPISTVSSIIDFFIKVYPKQTTFWAGYECFYIRWNSSFLDFSYR